jgi:hypothetical protein
MNYAIALLNKFDHDPAKAFACGNNTYVEFLACWAVVFPGTYWQRYRRAAGDGGVQFRYIDMTDSGEE